MTHKNKKHRQLPKNVILRMWELFAERKKVENGENSGTTENTNVTVRVFLSTWRWLRTNNSRLIKGPN